MTCIVGLVDDSRVWMGGDSASANAYEELTLKANPKVFHNKSFLIGSTGSGRLGDLLQYSLDVPEQPERMDVRHFIVTLFIDAVRQCLKKGGYQKKDDEREIGGTFLVGYSGRLFRVCNDFQVVERAIGFDAVGCADIIACGAMYATAEQKPRERILTALQASELFSTGVRGPFTIKSIESSDG